MFTALDAGGSVGSSASSIPFTQALLVVGTKLRTILPWAFGLSPEELRSSGQLSPPACLEVSKSRNRVDAVTW
jgi:hypothetical protein